jgi:hypothetical protein
MPGIPSGPLLTYRIVLVVIAGLAPLQSGQSRGESRFAFVSRLIRDVRQR